MRNVNTSYLSFLPLVSRGNEQARVLPIMNQIDFALDTQFSIDLTAMIQSYQLLHQPQSIFLDASGIPLGITLMEVFGTGQHITIAEKSLGYFPFLCTQNSFVFTFSNYVNKGISTSAKLQVCFMNVPFVTQIWSPAATEAVLAGQGYGN